MPDAEAARAHLTRKRPGWFPKNVFNRIVAALTRLGISLLGSRVLEVRGRTSGLPRRTPVNLLELDGERYLVAPRGDTQWARNLRVSGEGRLRLGRKLEPFTAIEVTDEAEIERLRAGEVPIHEPGLGELLARSAGAVHFSSELDGALAHARLLFVAVGTPSTYSGDADLSAVHAVVEAIPPSEEHALVM